MAVDMLFALRLVGLVDFVRDVSTTIAEKNFLRLRFSKTEFICRTRLIMLKTSFQQLPQ